MKTRQLLADDSGCLCVSVCRRKAMIVLNRKSENRTEWEHTQSTETQNHKTLTHTTHNPQKNKKNLLRYTITRLTEQTW